MSSCYSSLAPRIFEHASSYIHLSFFTTPQLPTQSTHTTHPHTHNNQLYLLDDERRISQASGYYLLRWGWSLYMWLWEWIDPHSCVLCHHINTSHPPCHWIWYHHHVLLLLSSAQCIIIHVSSSIHPFAFQPWTYKPTPHIPHHTHTQQWTISFGLWQAPLPFLRLLCQQVSMVPMAVIVRMDLSSLLCAVPSYHYLPSTWRWIRYHRHVFLLLFLSLMNHPTCIVIIHRTICIPTEQIPTPSTPPSQNTLMHALSCLPSIHILEQVTPLSPTPQSRSTEDTHNNWLT